jgi:hypothetical protein
MEITQSERENLGQELKGRGQIDWDLTIGSQRPKKPTGWKKVEKNRRSNTDFLKETIEKYGWPAKSLVGPAASHWAWYIAQHSDHNVEFQKKCLEEMKKLSSGQTNKYDLAHLEDRVRLNLGQKQLYGTQYKRNSEGGRELMPVEDKERLSDRRKEMGLDESLESHHKRMLSE